MQFGSKQKRNLISGSVLSIVPDTLIALVAASWTDSRLLGFVVTLVGLQVLYLLIWVKNAIWGWLLFWMRGRKQMTAHLLDYLRSNSYPEPDEYQDDAESYFQSIASNEQLSVDLRMKASAELGSFNALRLAGRMGFLLQTFLACEDAIQQYKASFPPRAFA